MFNMLESAWVDRWGKYPGVFISFEDGLRLVRERASRVALAVRQKEYDGESRNVFVDVPGSRHPDEIILIGAHMDSHRQMDGAHDNGAGTVVAMELLRHFATSPPLRSLRFVWFGSEELGCKGSQAYVECHAGELDSLVFMLNLDLGGGIIGQDAVDAMGPPELRTYFELQNKERGLDLNIREKVYGGDNGPFIDKGIPAVTIYRAGGTCQYIHTAEDSLDLVDAVHLEQLGGQALVFLDLVANAYRFPFARSVPETIQKEFRRLQVEYMGVKPTANR
jgi:Zn-dependent M28 family amino/carboxypeptidase